MHIIYKPLHFLLQPRMLMVAWTFSLKVACVLNPLSVLCFLMICATWLINFQMVLFYMRLSSVYLVSIQQLRKLIAEM